MIDEKAAKYAKENAGESDILKVYEAYQDGWRDANQPDITKHDYSEGYLQGLKDKEEQCKGLLDAFRELIRCLPVDFGKNMLEPPVTFNEYYDAVYKAKEALFSFGEIKSQPSEKYTHCNHHHELTEEHEMVNFGYGEFVANKSAIPLLKALNDAGLKTRTHHFGNNGNFISILLDNVEIKEQVVNEVHSTRTQYNGKKELLIFWDYPISEWLESLPSPEASRGLSAEKLYRFVKASERLPKEYKVVACKNSEENYGPRVDTKLHWGFIDRDKRWDGKWKNEDIEWLEETPEVGGLNKQVILNEIQDKIKEVLPAAHDKWHGGYITALQDVRDYIVNIEENHEVNSDAVAFAEFISKEGYISQTLAHEPKQLWQIVELDENYKTVEHPTLTTEQLYQLFKQQL